MRDGSSLPWSHPQVALDIRDLVSVEDAMEELQVYAPVCRFLVRLGNVSSFLFFPLLSLLLATGDPRHNDDTPSPFSQFGPNGGLMFCMEYLLENLDWLHEGLGDYEDDYVIFDCPGQIELYAHSPVMRRLVDALKVPPPSSPPPGAWLPMWDPEVAESRGVRVVGACFPRVECAKRVGRPSTKCQQSTPLIPR